MVAHTNRADKNDPAAQPHIPKGIKVGDLVKLKSLGRQARVVTGNSDSAVTLVPDCFEPRVHGFVGGRALGLAVVDDLDAHATLIRESLAERLTSELSIEPQCQQPVLAYLREGGTGVIILKPILERARGRAIRRHDLVVHRDA